jgi:prefoldin subunit 5
MVLSSGNPLPSKLQAEVPKAKVEVPSAASVAGLEKRVVQLEAGMKASPTIDTSQLEAQLKGLESQLTAVQTQLGTFRMSDFDALKTKIDNGKENSESVKTTIDALRTDIGTLHTRVDQLSQQATSATAPELKPDPKPDPKQMQKSQHSKSR